MSRDAQEKLSIVRDYLHYWLALREARRADGAVDAGREGITDVMLGLLHEAAEECTEAQGELPRLVQRLSRGSKGSVSITDVEEYIEASRQLSGLRPDDDLGIAMEVISSTLTRLTAVFDAMSPGDPSRAKLAEILDYPG